MFKYTRILLLTLIATTYMISSANAELLVINEFMARNHSEPPLSNGELLDEDDDPSDWIEIYNPSDEAINLDGSHPENCPGSIDLWPVEADGDGMALTRKVPIDYGNDPENWTIAAPSPGE